jgi:glycosyl transferase family 4
VWSKSRDAIVNVLMVIPSVGPLGGSERSALLAASGLRRLGHRVYLMHAGDEAVAGFDGYLSTPAAFDVAAYVDGRAVRRDIARMASFVAAHRIDVCHVQWIPRLGVYAWLARTLPLVHSIHVTPCPNGARYLWRDRQPCERRIGLGCFTTGYRSHGCGTLGRTPLSVFVAGEAAKAIAQWAPAGHIARGHRRRPTISCMSSPRSSCSASAASARRCHRSTSIRRCTRPAS